MIFEARVNNQVLPFSSFNTNNNEVLKSDLISKNDNGSDVSQENNIDKATKKSFSQIWNESSTIKKIGLVFSLTFLAVPVTTFYIVRDNVPSLIRGTINRIVLPICRTIEKVVKSIFIDFPKFVFNKILQIPLTIKNAVVWTYNHILTPIGLAIKNVVKAVFVTIPEWIYRHTVEPVTRFLKNVAVWTIDNIIRPIPKLISSIVRGIFVKFPKMIIDHVMAPIGRAIKKVAVWTYDHMIVPTVRTIKNIVNFMVNLSKLICQNIVKPVGRAIAKAVNWTIDNIIRPIPKLICYIVKEVFIRLPKCVIVSIGNAIKNVAVWTYETLRTSLEEITKVYNEVIAPIPQFVYDNVYLPVSNMIEEGRQWTYEQFVLPITEGTREFFYETLPATLAGFRNVLART